MDAGYLLQVDLTNFAKEAIFWCLTKLIKNNNHAVFCFFLAPSSTGLTLFFLPAASI